MYIVISFHTKQFFCMKLCIIHIKHMIYYIKLYNLYFIRQFTELYKKNV